MSAFADSERAIVAKLAVDLLSEKTVPRTVALVAEYNGTLAGHIAFSPVTIGGGHLQGYILAPLGVKAERQKRGIGSALVERGMRMLSGSGAHVLFVYGDPAYYTRFGFSAETAAPYIPPCRPQHPFGWQAVVLNGGTTPQSPVTVACVAPLCDPKLW